MSMTVPSFSFVIPALNEEKNLPAAVAEVQAAARAGGVVDYEIIVVDDGSTDGTAAAAERLCARHGGIRLMRNETRRGVGKSFLAGAALATKEYCLIVPGDNEFGLEFFPGAVAALAGGGADLVVTHVVNPALRPCHRRVISFCYLGLFNFLFGTRFRYTNGIVIYPSGWIRSVDLLSGGYTFQSEALLKAHREGKRFAHAGMTIRPRAHGRSKIFSFGVLAEVLKSLARIKRADRKRSPTTG